MTKTDFAELKEKLILNLTKCKYASVYYATYEATVSELIEIIKLQSEALDQLKEYPTVGELRSNSPIGSLEQREDIIRHSHNIAQQTVSETTTRLQKLRDGI